MRPFPIPTPYRAPDGWRLPDHPTPFRKRRDALSHGLEVSRAGQRAAAKPGRATPMTRSN